MEFFYPPISWKDEKGEIQTSKKESLRSLKNDETVATHYTLPPQWDHLPFIALPDGSHLKEEDCKFFFLNQNI